MDKDWKTENLPLNKMLTLWIKCKIEGSPKGTIIIEIKDSKVVLVHYKSSEYVLDIND